MKKIESYLQNIRKQILFEKNDLKYKRDTWEKAAIILMGEPEYGNLGDHAIAYATKLYMEENFPGHEFISITENDIRYNFRHVTEIVGPQDVLLLQGGGNTGDMYPDQVALRKRIITYFHNKILLMPQTVHFSGDNMKIPTYFLDNSERVILTAREEESYRIIKSIYPGRVLMLPDIVLSMLPGHEEGTRTGALVCLRHDKERDPNVISEEKIIKILESKSIPYRLYSTVIKESVPSDRREHYLNLLFNDFWHSEIVITDRLHAMIISAITSTPCIVLPTFNHKVTDSYKWLEALNYISLVEGNDFPDKLEQVMNLSVKSKLDIHSAYEPLRQAVFEMLGEKSEK